ncbi:hypothetical protein GTY87_30785 [Streptomyces sp. SID7813]|uniref:Uncharacterized protein n=1 Tax=Streptomyces lividans 1326 TaxID=1200984 RepID=A0A7U9DVW4_STRLI|nr:predicted protein [Streptomyces lividans TK24]EOY51109.1 hypothetical protein SLI_6402 [Streptomyces lividans 1326]MYU45533.1 hypothetical protein [Streptomyces sp. SID7813]NSL82071.1 hypothetical protein [Streptomyces coelicolor]QFI45855.1 hypothetical protein FQ762_31090 [Streptomyces coelicolor A3(2)]THA98322.1 hypothetical protein E6R61_07605 [Streptomyces sp. LRa12]
MFRSGGTCPGGASYVTRSALPRGGPFYVFPVRVLRHVAVRLGDTFTRVVQSTGRAVSRPGGSRRGRLV